ncbi:MAG: [FeFe] hydrogenase, group A [Candidatus Woesebacteria bacterium]|jgi:iron-only hydrogenase group A
MTVESKNFISIDHKKYLFKEGESVLQVAIRNKVDIPHFCYHEDLKVEASCRVCLVEIVKTGEIVTSCSLKAEPGLEVVTDSDKVQILRTENLELLLADHQKKCPRCQEDHFCKTAELMKKYGITGKKYKKRILNKPKFKMATAAECDPEACIKCNQCVKICEYIGVNFLRLEGKASATRISYSKDEGVDCIYCGQCTVHCPVNAVREQSHLEQVEAALADPDKIVIAQMAPSVRASIGEEFGQELGKNLAKQMYTAFRKLGFDKIFDVNMGADITTVVEAEELVERIKHNGTLPMFTSCCPGWVKFLEFYYPDMIPHLTTARSPQIHSGGAYKTWWAKKEGVDPKKIVVVSFMPCTSKKYEARHEKLKINGLFPVDYVLTTREAAVLLKKNKIDLANLEASEVDKAGTFSGAAAIYGASGGVMESALRTAAHLLAGDEFKKIDFEEVRGMEGIKRATVQIGDKTLKVAVVAMAKNARIILEEIKKKPQAYDYVEFMACPGGCIGGGGQPIPSTLAIIQQRINGLYAIDKKMTLRKAHENPVVKEFFDYVKKLPENEQAAILHTSYSIKKKFE